MEKFNKKVESIVKAYGFLDFKHRKQLVEACIILHLRYAIELQSQGTTAQIRKAERMLSRGARIILVKGGRNWQRVRG